VRRLRLVRDLHECIDGRKPVYSHVVLQNSTHSEMDESEPGDRELSGEWVVGRNVWKRLKSERMRDATSSHTGGTSSDNDRRPSWSRRTTGAKSREASMSGHTTTTDLEGVGNGSGRTSLLSASVRASSMDVSERRKRKHRGEEKVIYYIHGGECRMRCLRWRDNVLKKAQCTRC
jgi:hypothetical protein